MSRAAGRLRAAVAHGKIAAMQHACATVHGLLTSAYMAAGMTSRARRPEAHLSLG